MSKIKYNSIEELETKADNYRRQLGGLTASHNRLKQENKELREFARTAFEAIALGSFLDVIPESTNLKYFYRRAIELNLVDVTKFDESKLDWMGFDAKS